MTHVRAFALFTSMLSCLVFGVGPAAANCEHWEFRGVQLRAGNCCVGV